MHNKQQNNTTQQHNTHKASTSLFEFCRGFTSLVKSQLNLIGSFRRPFDSWLPQLIQSHIKKDVHNAPSRVSFRIKQKWFMIRDGDKLFSRQSRWPELVNVEDAPACACETDCHGTSSVTTTSHYHTRGVTYH